MYISHIISCEFVMYMTFDFYKRITSTIYYLNDYKYSKTVTHTNKIKVVLYVRKFPNKTFKSVETNFMFYQHCENRLSIN